MHCLFLTKWLAISYQLANMDRQEYEGKCIAMDKNGKVVYCHKDINKLMDYINLHYKDQEITLGTCPTKGIHIATPYS